MFKPGKLFNIPRGKIDLILNTINKWYLIFSNEYFAQSVYSIFIS